MEAEGFGVFRRLSGVLGLSMWGPGFRAEALALVLLCRFLNHVFESVSRKLHNLWASGIILFNRTIKPLELLRSVTVVVLCGHMDDRGI